MDAYILSLLARNTGTVVSRNVALMQTVLASTLEESEIVLHLQYGNVSGPEGSFPVYLEADIDSIEVYSKVGAGREQMLLCTREDGEFVVVGGALMSSLPKEEL